MAMQGGMVHDPSAWLATDFARQRQWARPFSPEMLAEIDAAVAVARRRGLRFWEVTREEFPLPRTAPMIAEGLHELEEGTGFAVFSGFPVDRYGYDENLMAYALVSCHLGHIVEQTHKGDRVIDVVDIGKPYSHTSRGYSSNKMLPFHTDGADMVGLLCLGTAQAGGVSAIASAASVYNCILRERPDVLAILERGFHHHRRGEQEPGEPPVSAARIPVFSFHNGLLHCCYNRNPIEWAQKEGVALSGEEIAALDYLDSVLARPEVQLCMDLQVGDIQYLNNYVCFHSRTEYVDGPGHRRHLLRMWLNLRHSRRAGPTLLNLYAPRQARQRLPS